MILGEGGKGRRRSQLAPEHSPASRRPLLTRASAREAQNLPHIAPKMRSKQAGADKRLRNRQDKAAADLCQACWSHSWRYAREALDAHR